MNADLYKVGTLAAQNNAAHYQALNDLANHM